MAQTSIEWADDTRNWQSGCTEARRPDGTMDPACVHCYARLMSARLEAMGVGHYDGAAVRAAGGARWTGKITWSPDLLESHMRALRPGRVTFVGSMTDLWHEGATDRAWAALASAAREVSTRPADKLPRGMVTLTKRADRLLAFQRQHFPEGLPSWWWAGVTVADQTGADLRLPALMELRTAGPRVVSYEPAMGPVDWRPWMGPLGDRAAAHIRRGRFPLGGYAEWSEIGWLIAGGESGPKARPSHPRWFQRARDAAVAAKVPFFFKQVGEWAWSGPHNATVMLDERGVVLGPNQRFISTDGEAGAVLVTRVGKSAAGRLLDGREWSEVPDVE